MARSEVLIWVVCSLCYWIDVTQGITTRMASIFTVMERESRRGSSSGHLQDSTTMEPSQSGLPPGWSKLCTIDQDFVDKTFLRTISVESIESIVQISCQISRTGDSLVFSHLRDWMKAQNGSKFALRVTGHGNEQTGGMIHLPWPMKAERLVYLEVNGCNIKGYYSEYSSTELSKIPDELRVLEIKNSVIFFDISKLPELIEDVQQLSSDIECGPLTVERYVFSNVTYWMDFDSFDFDFANSENGTSVPDYDAMADKLLNHFENSDHVCKYDSLRYVDESISDSVGEIHFYLQHLKSLYPEVRMYNASHVGMTDIPRELRQWRQNHPNMDYMDLSHNGISHIDFTASDSPIKRIGTIDLQYNAITNLSRYDLDTLRKLPTVTLNLRNNPFDCNCGVVADLYNFVKEHSHMKAIGMQRYEYLRNLTCVTPSYLAGTVIENLSSADVYCKAQRIVGPRTGRPTSIYVPIFLVIATVLLIAAFVFIVHSYRAKRSEAVSLSNENLVSVDLTKC